MESHESSELFTVRNNSNGYYISMKNGPYQVQDTPYFTQWSEAKSFLRDNWRKLYDEEFERTVLIGSEECTVNDDPENSSTT